MDYIIVILDHLISRSAWPSWKPGSWLGWTWIQWSAWRSEMIKSTPPWRNPPTARTTTKWVGHREIHIYLPSFLMEKKSTMNLNNVATPSFLSPVFRVRLPRASRCHVRQNPEVVRKSFDSSRWSRFIKCVWLLQRFISFNLLIGNSLQKPSAQWDAGWEF